MKRFWIVSGMVLVAAAGGAGVYLWSQDARFDFSAERTGFCLLKGGYRAYYVSFCDGYGYDLNTRKSFPGYFETFLCKN